MYRLSHLPETPSAASLGAAPDSATNSNPQVDLSLDVRSEQTELDNNLSEQNDKEIDYGDNILPTWICESIKYQLT